MNRSQAGSGTPSVATPPLPVHAAHAASTQDLLTAEEVAVLLRVTPAWVYAQTRSQRIPHLRLGRYVRYRREALDSWMREVETSPSLRSRTWR
jgi:excisionase family DNA binding protein